MSEMTMKTPANEWKGRTNIRKAMDLIDRAAKVTDEIAVIPQLDNLSLPIHITSKPITQDKLNEFRIYIREARKNWWIKGKTNGTSWQSADSPPESLRVPHITMSPSVRNFWAEEHPGREAQALEDRMAYILVVHGKNGPMQPKVVVKWDLGGAAQAMMQELQEGYSVVFAGAVLKHQWKNLPSTRRSKSGGESDPSFKLTRVESLEALVQVDPAFIDAFESPDQEEKHGYYNDLRIFC